VLDGVATLLLNALLIAAGVGLLAKKEWGRRLSLWTAGLKIAAAVVIQAYYLTVVVPDLSAGMATMVSGMVAQQADPAEAEQAKQMFGTVYSITYGGVAIMTLLLAIIYPIVSLTLLTRPRVVEAMQAQSAMPPAQATAAT
jgi:nitrogen fixation/metabolism regulation signal transduction histidine kinase